ncbi:NADPH-dependent glutamate synthase beta subunit-like oxidoreductase [Anaerobacterium chartisolvens]|uniref:NADPH-dependent glutamate synthase beta subunit-like oxidoreductase n=1 Tax=Anaerobacterium chartisolvens TaxID=1297424 RepID=A0A369B3X5_9FIRM|nr:FAD-dependent oxidoreductase [Anaerobacterium chartisolvens]RCX16025.1 NADPH-dependent glutamate synthase beta subunit-like oxidoreductase [Anaerobacterium chartisolvens]
MGNIKLTIDGISVEAEKEMTVLQAALAAGIYIPHLCHHPSLPDVGQCKLCVVEIADRDGVQTSCTTMAEDGMVIKTKTDRLNHMRTLSMELMLAAHPSECTSCPKYLKCELQTLIQYLGVSDARLRKLSYNFPIETGNPLFVRDMNRCILCGRCVRACRTLRGAEAIDYKKDNEKVYIGTENGGLLADENCKFCCACVEVCPTGALRDKEEVVSGFNKAEEALLPCKASCPAGTDVPRYVRLIKEGKYSEAVAVIRERVPFPLTLGYICMHFCESGCRREAVNEAVSVKELKKFAAMRDNGLWKENSKIAPLTGKKVAVIGSGPAGLTSAYYLVKQGHDVTIYEKLSSPGGMLRVGIPEYRLPRSVIDNEISEITDAGVRIVYNTDIKDLNSLSSLGYDAVLIAIGTHKGVRLPIPGSDLKGVMVNTDFLLKSSLGKKVETGSRVLVLGGGNVAFDCARVAKRLGASEVSMACLESRANMTASAEEVEQGLEEGIVIHNSRTFSKIISENGSLGVECSEVDNFYFDDNRKLVINTVPDSLHVLYADTVIFAAGQIVDLPEEYGVESGRANIIKSENYQTNKAGVFAVGDCITGTTSVVQAIAGGRGAAAAIDKYLGGDGVIDEVLAPCEEPGAFIGKEERFAHRERKQISCKPVEERINNFDEFEQAFDAETAHCEAERCLQCDLRLRIPKVKLWGDYAHK